MKQEKFKRWGNILGRIVTIFLVCWVQMLLWNALVPELFKGPEITYWQMMGLSILTKSLVNKLSNSIFERKQGSK